MDSRAGQSRAFVVVCSLLALVVGGVIGYFTPHASSGVPIEVSTPSPTDTPVPTPTVVCLRVHVAGAVNDPGVYELSQGSIVQDAIEAAGGAAAGADLNRVNLAVEVADQQQVYVPREGEVGAPAQPSTGALASGAREAQLVNINTASLAQLDTLPGVGPVTAQRIIDYRTAHGPFERIEDIQNVPRIGPATFEGIRQQITVGP